MEISSIWNKTHREKPKLNNQFEILPAAAIRCWIPAMSWIKLVKTPLCFKSTFLNQHAWKTSHTHLLVSVMCRNDKPVVMRSKTRGTPTKKVGFNSAMSSDTFLISCMQHDGSAQCKYACKIPNHFPLLCPHS